MIIGLTGSLGAGKGVVSDFLKERGFVYLSLSNELRELIKEKKMKITRENLQDEGNKLREKKGGGALAELVFEKIKNQEYKKAVVDGIRNPAEIEVLKKLKDFHLIAVDAPREIRFERIKERDRESDPKTWEEFLKIDERDQKEENKMGQQVGKCIDMADFKINNDSSMEKVEEEIVEIFDKLENKDKKRKNYLSWDEYFMAVSLVSAQRSKDPNTQVGACIVNKEKKIVGAGYNGFPTGCSDDNLPWNREGEFLDTKYPYVCHAELNAILNATQPLNDCSIYVALFPCNECAKAIIQSGIKEVVYLSDKYVDLDMTKAAKKMFNQAGIRLRQLAMDKDKIKINL